MVCRSRHETIDDVFYSQRSRNPSSITCNNVRVSIVSMKDIKGANAASDVLPASELAALGAASDSLRLYVNDRLPTVLLMSPFHLGLVVLLWIIDQIDSGL